MNRLKNETSPYLQQHADNPVKWYPWGDEAFQNAKKENKLVFISIGYSACHWCHVMEKESFENQEISDFLNKKFISIKVDREERPDIDKSYMSAVQLMNGSGGWPLNCFATPEGKPFYGGTYYPRENFLQIIIKLSSIWESEPSKIEEHAAGLCEGVQNSELIQEKLEFGELGNLDAAFEKLKKEFDTSDGGLKRVPKFLTPVVYRFLFRYWKATNNTLALQQSSLTINKILDSGMYDQLSGGLARYSTDKTWFVPHFEKMLYDNSQFISLLAEFYLITGNSFYKEKMIETIDYINQTFKDGTGGFYSSLDADSEGIEGKYYTWKYKELKEITGKNFNIIADYFGISPEGNWLDDRNILSVRESAGEMALKYEIDEEKLKEIISDAKSDILLERDKRVKPKLDNKIITSWNALHAIAMCDAYQSTGDEKYLDMAFLIGEFLLEHMVQDDGNVNRLYGPSKPGFLDDYAFVLKAFFELYQLRFEEKWLEISKLVLMKTIQNFYSESTAMFFYSSEKETNPVARQTEIMDTVIPSSNSVMAEVLLYAFAYFDNIKYREMALQMVKNIQPSLIKNPALLMNWAKVQLLLANSFTEIVFTGKRMLEYRSGFCGKFLPRILFAGAEYKSDLSLLKGRLINGTSKIYVCENRTCKLPVEEVADALTQIS